MSTSQRAQDATFRLDAAFRFLRISGYTPNTRFIKYSPIDFFHPNVICDRLFGPWLKQPYPTVDSNLMHRLIILYLCDNEYTSLSLLRSPPRNIAILIDTCSYIFSARITTQFQQDMESFCATYDEKTTNEGGVAHTLFVFPSSDGVFDERSATLEDWIGVMANVVCKEYNRKMELTKMAVAIRAAGVVEKRSVWESMKHGVMKAIRMKGRTEWRDRKGWGVAAWVYSNIKKPKG
ncbi:hypothetical protein TWF730_002299 [Orbilia blumenaviensis]|uniref:Uncharacterized protein n=1 Tax=Orbilia blumenaviensis TaxID=1796055 RepID=A0AAV9UDD1_9PEZI